MAAGVFYSSSMVQRDIISICLDDVGQEILAAYFRGRTGITAAFADQYTDGDFPFPHMPNLFACAENGVTFTQMRTTPICSPTRAAVLSGLYSHKNGCGGIVRGGSGSNNNVTETFIDFGNQDAPSIRSIAHVLKENGYRALAVGKWHLYLNDPDDPNNLTADEGFGGSGFLHPIEVLGFDEWAGTPRNPQAEGGTGYEDYRWYEWNRIAGVPNDLGVVTSPHLTQRTMQEAAATWTMDASKPRFLWLALNVAHGPFQWPPNGGGDQHNFDVAEPDSSWNNTRIRALLEHFDYWLGEFFTSIGFDPSNPDTTDPVIFIWGDNGTDQNSVNPLKEDDGVSVGVGEIKYPASHPGWSASWGGATAFAGTNADALSVDGYDSFHLKGSTFDQGLRVPLIVCGNSDVVTRADEFDDAVLDSVDLFAIWAALGEATDTKATGTVTITSQPDDASTLTVSDGYGLTVTFEFDSDNSVTAGNVQVVTSSDNGDTGIALRQAVNASALRIDAADNGSGVVTLTHQLPGATGNVAFVTSGTAGDWTATGMAGGRSRPTATDGVSFLPLLSSASSTLDEIRDYSYVGQQFAPNGIGLPRRQALEAFARVDGVNIWKRHLDRRTENGATTERFFNVGNPTPVAATGSITFSSALNSGDTITITDNILHDDADRPAGNEVSFVGGTDFTVGVSAIADMAALVAAITGSALDITPTDNLDGSCSLVNDAASYCNNDPITLSGTGVTGRVSVTGMSGGVAPDPTELCDLNGTAYVAANGTHPELAATLTRRSQILGDIDSAPATTRNQVNTTMSRASQIVPL